MSTAWMDAAAKIEKEMQFLREENNRKDRALADANNVIGSQNNIIDSMERSARLDSQRIDDMYARIVELERANAVLHSGYDDLQILINARGDQMAATSLGLNPDMILRPKTVQDDNVSIAERNAVTSRAAQRIEEILGGKDYVSELAQRSGLAEAAEKSSEVKPVS